MTLRQVPIALDAGNGLRHRFAMTAVHMLRSATAPDHDRVDAAFAGYDLGDRAAYIRFLLAHARALPSAEDALAIHDLPRWRRRAPMLAADLTALGEIMPDPLPFALPAGRAAALGALYVLEGSRLGGVLLARRVPATLPSAYLAAKHERGEWRALLAAIDADIGEVAAAEAVAGAHAAFALYAAAATDTPVSR